MWKGSKQAQSATNWPRMHGRAASAGAWLTVEESKTSATLQDSRFWGHGQEIRFS